jgi:hypothetical protein
MNNINKKIRTFSFVMALVSMILGGIFMQSCSSDSDINEMDKSEMETYMYRATGFNHY